MSLRQAINALPALEPREISGRVGAVRGLSVTVRDLPLPVGAIVRVDARARTGEVVRGEVVGFAGDESIVMLFNDSDGIAPGVEVVGEQSAQTVAVGAGLLGRVIDGRGRTIDGRPPPLGLEPRALFPDPTSPLERSPIRQPLPTGVRAVDAMLTIGKGQRIGIFSGPGIGKSTLLASIAQHTAADVNVIALIGERGREVREFLEETLGPVGRAKSVMVISTSDESPLLRVRAAAVACTVAEHFQAGGLDVLLMMDSITRFAQAQRQIGLTINEQPATKGYPPSVFALMPKLLERAGAFDRGGSITGLYSVLVEGDDLTEPISDAARGILDGHIALSRRLAARGLYPAIDLLESISRVADDVCDAHHIAARRHLLRLLAAYAEAEELVNIGAYARGSNPDCDVAIEMKPDLDAYLGQTSRDAAGYPETCRRLIELSIEASERAKRLASGRAAPVAAT